VVELEEHLQTVEMVTTVDLVEAPNEMEAQEDLVLLDKETPAVLLLQEAGVAVAAAVENITLAQTAAQIMVVQAAQVNLEEAVVLVLLLQ
tara:strand:+ start:226 stop:495 length:270 start_codon:yes stop_codon:yes gene_type:complete